MDYRALLFGPIYAAWGVPAVLQLGTGTFDISAIDRATGVSLVGPVTLETVRPHALVLRGDLDDLGVTLDQLDGGSIALNGKSWAILAHQSKPSPNGEAEGEVALMLEGNEG